MLALKIYGALVVVSFLLVGWLLLRPHLAALWYRLNDPEVYPPEAAGDFDADGDVFAPDLVFFAEQLIRRHNRGEDVTDGAPKERL